MVIVAKATQNSENGPVDYVEFWLPQYREMFPTPGRFAYAWTFNPDDRAIARLRQNLPFGQGMRETWLYLIGEPYYSPLRMRIINFRHYRQRSGGYPEEWRQYCIAHERGITRFADCPNWPPIHLWFLIDRIDLVRPPVDVRRFTPLFPDKYKMYGRTHFGFFEHDRG